MSKAYKCDMTGKVCAGEGVKNFILQLTPTCALLIHPQEKVAEGKFGQGEISPEAKASIEKALQPLVKMPPPEDKDGKK